MKYKPRLCKHKTTKTSQCSWWFKGQTAHKPNHKTAINTIQNKNTDNKDREPPFLFVFFFILELINFFFTDFQQTACGEKNGYGKKNGGERGNAFYEQKE